MNSLLVKDEALRLEALAYYEILNPTTDPVLNDLVRLAAQICQSPVAAISLLGLDRLWLKGTFGIDSHEAPLASTPCETTILGDSVYQLPDTRQHPAFMPMGILLKGEYFGFYAGAPLTTPSGITIGALFVLDIVPRTLTSDQSFSLSVLSREVINRFELNSRIRQIDRVARSRQRVESALTVERNFVSAVLDTIGALVVVFDTAGRIVRFNRTSELVSGYDFQSLVGRYAWDRLIPADQVSDAIESFNHIRSGRFPTAYENQWRSRSGELRRIAWSVTALLDAQGQVGFIIATGIDVTSERAAEETLRESEARYRQLIEGSLGMVCTHDLNGVVLSLNSHGARSLGRNLDEVVHHSLEEFISEERRPSLQRYLEEIVETGEAQGLLHLTHTDGDTRVIAYRNKLIDAPGRAPYVLAFGVDITEQVRAEGRLRTLTRQSDSVLESIGDGIFGIDTEGSLTVVNSAAAQMLGYRQEELLGKNMHNLIHHTRPDGSPYPAEDCPIRNTLSHRNTVRIANEVFWRKDGTSFPVEYVARPQIDPQHESQEDSRPEPSPDLFITAPGPGKALGVVVAFTDTTERRALDRMKDEFISTVSHELRTPLTALRGALGLLTGDFLGGKPEKAQKMLDIALGNTDRVVNLVNDILDLERVESGKAGLQQTMCSAEDLLRRAAEIQFTRTPRPDIRIFFSATGVNVWADPERILQTLNNLLSNAIKFSRPGSEVYLSAHAIDENEAILEVRDEGRGIPADKLDRVFDRFQQGDASDTRDSGGTGLGLAICRSIIRQHGGRIWATSTPGEGTTIHFILPTRPASNLR